MTWLTPIIVLLLVGCWILPIDVLVIYLTLAVGLDIAGMDSPFNALGMLLRAGFLYWVSTYSWTWTAGGIILVAFTIPLEQR